MCLDKCSQLRILSHPTLLLQITHGINYWRCYDTLLEIVESWFPELLGILGEVEDVVVNLEGDPEVSSKIEQPSLILQVQIENYAYSSAAQ